MPRPLLPVCLLLTLLAGPVLAQPGRVPVNPQIDYAGFAAGVAEVGAVRESRRLTEAEFLRVAAEPGTVVLDARSERLFARRHIRGAVNLPFPEFTAETLARVIPAHATRVLIYCNNNFKGAPESMPLKTMASALNLSTFVSLHTYGYRNVFELGPAVDVKRTGLPFEGTEVS